MAQAIRMPALGQTTDELVIVGWLKQVGDTVKAGEPLLTVETDKSTLEVESAFGGTLLHIVHALPATVQTGDVIAYVGAPGETIGPEAAGTAAAKPTAPAAPAMPSTPAISNAPPPAAGKVLATPAARQLAKEHGIDLNTLTGSGPGGRIEREDVQRVI